MNEQQVAEAVRDWARETIPDLTAGYAYLPAQKTTLPDVAVDLREKRIVLGPDERFPFSALDQVSLKVFELVLGFLVEAGTGDSADEDETQLLQGYGALLEAAVLDDATLGDRVPMASPFIDIVYDLPFIQYPDGVRGRQMTMNMAVGELIEQEGAL